jgi:hypothetical protein
LVIDHTISNGSTAKAEVGQKPFAKRLPTADLSAIEEVIVIAEPQT